MSTKSNKTVKETKVSNQKETVVSKINLSSLTDQLSKVELKEKIKKQTIYKYPEGFTEKDMNSEKGKKFRNGLRNKLRRFVNNVLSYAKQHQINKSAEAENLLQKEISEFMTFYKDNYRINDLSFDSISNTKDEDKTGDIKLFIHVVKQVQA